MTYSYLSFIQAKLLRVLNFQAKGRGLQPFVNHCFDCELALYQFSRGNFLVTFNWKHTYMLKGVCLQMRTWPVHSCTETTGERRCSTKCSLRMELIFNVIRGAIYLERLSSIIIWNLLEFPSVQHKIRRRPIHGINMYAFFVFLVC